MCFETRKPQDTSESVDSRDKKFSINSKKAAVLPTRRQDLLSDDTDSLKIEKVLPHDNKPSQLFLFGNDLSSLSPNTQFACCVCGVFTFNVLYGFLQELLSINIAGRRFALFLAAVQFAGYSSISYVLSILNRSSNKKPLYKRSQISQAPSGKFVALSLLRAFDLAITYSAMRYLNYPAKTLIKSCRVVFTMLMGVMIRRKRYSSRDYIAVFTLVTGLLVFLHADASTDVIFHPWGVFLLMISMICDGSLNNWAEQMMDEYNLTQDEFHFKLYSVAFVATLVAAYVRNELFEGIDFFLLRPGTIPEIESTNTLDDITWTQGRKAAMLVLFGSSGILGASCLGAITKRFGALTMSLTSTVRKATTLFLSFAIFENQCTSEHSVGIFLFLSGLMMKTLNKRSSKA